MEKIEDSKPLSINDATRRLRWTIIEVPMATTATIDDTSATSMSSDKSQYRSTTPQRKVVLLERLLKPMYRNKAYVRESSYSYSYSMNKFGGDGNIDSQVYVDMDDKTMWLSVFNEPIDLDDFYKKMVSGDLFNADFSKGKDVDENPSFNLVPLLELKETLVAWWCK